MEPEKQTDSEEFRFPHSQNFLNMFENVTMDFSFLNELAADRVPSLS